MTALVVSFRCCSKPFYRWAFSKGKSMTKDSIREFNHKYICKYITKRQKMGLDKDIVEKGDIARVSTTITTFLNKDMESPPTVSALAKAVRDGHPNLMNTDHVSPVQEINVLCEYCCALHAASISNVGLSHAKVREYWLYRGPRQLFTILIFVAGSLMLQEVLRDLSFEDRAVLLLTALLAMSTALFMLYYRLPDSIRSGVCRSAHDHYVKSKKKLDLESKMAVVTAKV